MKSTSSRRAAVKEGARRKHVVDEPTMQSLLHAYAEGSTIPRPTVKAERDRLLVAVRDVQHQRLREAMWNMGVTHGKLSAALKADPSAPRDRAKSWLFNSLYNDRLIDRREAVAIARICSMDPAMLTQHLDHLPWLTKGLRGRRLKDDPPQTEVPLTAETKRGRGHPGRTSVAVAPADGTADAIGRRRDMVVQPDTKSVHSMKVHIDGEATLSGLATATTILDGFELAFGMASDEALCLHVEGDRARLEFDVPIAGIPGSRMRIPPAVFGLAGGVEAARMSIMASLAPNAADVARERRIARGEHHALDDTILDEIVLRLCAVEGIDARDLVHAVPDNVEVWSSFEQRDDHETQVRLPRRLPPMSGSRTPRSLDVRNVGLHCSIILDVFGRSGVAIPGGSVLTTDVVGQPIGHVASTVHAAIADLRIISASQEENMTLYMLETRPMRSASTNPSDHTAGLLLARRLTDWALAA